VCVKGAYGGGSAPEARKKMAVGGLHCQKQRGFTRCVHMGPKTTKLHTRCPNGHKNNGVSSIRLKTIEKLHQDPLKRRTSITSEVLWRARQPACRLRSSSPPIHVRGTASPHHRGKAVRAMRPKCPAGVFFSYFSTSPAKKASRAHRGGLQLSIGKVVLLLF
jgi:hypothetical protein